MLFLSNNTNKEFSYKKTYKTLFRIEAMKQKQILIFLGVLVVVLSSYYAYGYFFPEPKVPGTPTPTINITYDNFAKELSRTALIRAIPSNAEVLIKFYNFNSGTRVFEKNFIIKNGNLQETTQESAEVAILLHSKYISSLTNKNLCSTFKTANRAGDMAIETKLSTASLAWKFKSMAKYKDCF